jgi:capsular polysaccharide biosynthesis protein
MNDSQVKFEERIELMNILRTVWKWKYLILIGTLAFAVIVGIISFHMTKIYQIDMIVMPGILKIDQGGKHTYIDSPENIKALIEAGTFNEQILENMGKANNKDLPKWLTFKVNIPNRSNTLKISYQISNIDQGINILSNLSRLLLEKYDKLVSYFQVKYEMQINPKKNEIDSLKVSLQSSKQIMKNIQERINQLTSEIALINKNTISLIEERDNLLSKGSTDKILSSILYINTIQQNLSLANTYKNEINEYSSQKENEKVELEKIQKKIKDTLEEIKNLEFEKKSIQNIQIVQAPISRPYPVKPKKKLNVMFAVVVGCFTMLFLAFLLEYIAKHKTIIKKD